MSINLIFGRASLVSNADGSKSVAFRPSFGKPADKDGGVTGFRNLLKRAVNVTYNGHFGLLRAKDAINNAISDRQTAIRYKKFASAFKNQIRNLDSKQSPNFDEPKTQARQDYQQNGTTLLATAQAKLLTAQETLANVKNQNQVSADTLKAKKTELANAVADLKSLETARVGETREFADLSALQTAKQLRKQEIAGLAKEVAQLTFAQKVYTRTEARLERDVQQAEQRVNYATKQLAKIIQATDEVVVPASVNIAPVVENTNEQEQVPATVVGQAATAANNAPRLNNDLAVVLSGTQANNAPQVTREEAISAHKANVAARAAAQAQTTDDVVDENVFHDAVEGNINTSY